MVATETRYEHIVLDERQIPHIVGTTMKVVELVMAHQAYGWNPEELAVQFPHLTLGQIFSALAYYWDHCQEMEDNIAESLRRVDELRRRAPVPPIVERLRAGRSR